MHPSALAASPREHPKTRHNELPWRLIKSDHAKKSTSTGCHTLKDLSHLWLRSPASMRFMRLRISGKLGKYWLFGWRSVIYVVGFSLLVLTLNTSRRRPFVVTLANKSCAWKVQSFSSKMRFLCLAPDSPEYNVFFIWILPLYAASFKAVQCCWMRAASSGAKGTALQLDTNLICLKQGIHCLSAQSTKEFALNSRLFDLI